MALRTGDLSLLFCWLAGRQLSIIIIIIIFLIALGTLFPKAKKLMQKKL